MRLPRRVALVAIAASVVSSMSAARAYAADLPGDQDKTLPCRPTIACTADMIPPGTFEIESGVLFRRLGDSTRQWTTPFLAKLTLAEWIQVQVGSNGFDTARGPDAQEFFDDVLVGAKLHLHDQTTSVPSLSISATASVPTAHEQEGFVPAYDALFTGYVTKDFGPIHADLNAGYNLWRFDGSPRSQAFTALALSMNLPPPFGIMAEGYAFSDAAPMSPRDGGFLFAVSLTPRPWLILDAGGDVGWFPSTRDFSVFIGMTFIPVVLWRP